MGSNRRQELAASVAIGKDGFLFHRFERTFEQICGDVLLSGAALDRWVSLLEARHAWCRTRNIPYLFLCVPEKHVVYEDKLPEGVRVSPERPIQRILGGLDKRVQPDFVYPATLLRDARSVEETFFRTDVHWSPWGAYLAYRELLHAIGRHLRMEPIPMEALRKRTFRMVGDLGIRLDPEPHEDGIELSYPSERRVRRIFGNHAYTVGQVEILVTDDESLPRGVLFRDSQASSMLPFLAGHFSRLVVVAAAEMFHELVRSEAPDLVITQTSERQIARPVALGVDEALLFPDDFTLRGFAELTRLRLPLPRREDVLHVDLRAPAHGAARTHGWSHPEPGHIWAVDEESELTVPVRNPGRDHVLELDVQPFLHPPEVTRQQLQVSANGVPVGAPEVTGAATLAFRLPAACLTGPELTLTLRHPDGRCPAEFGAPDHRCLSLSFTELRLREAIEEPVAA